VPNSDRSGGRSFDRAHGVTTHAVMLLSQLDATRTSEAYAHATHYEAVPVADLRAMLAALPADALPAATFVDVGAGMGRALLIAGEYPFKQIAGIELSPALFEIAKENLARARGLKTRCRDVRLIRGDARRRAFPKGDLVIFLFNPFDAQALGETLERVVASRAARDTVYALYHTPVHREVLDGFAAETVAELPCGVIARLRSRNAPAAEASGTERSGVSEHVAVALGVDVEQNADRGKERQDCGTAERDERQRDAGDRHDPDRHADVDEDVKEQHRDDTGGE
jgi:SAM-dependent methyltransferase